MTSKTITKEYHISGLAIVVVVLLIYFGVQAGKALSYSWFYRDMVKETVTEMEKQQCLKP